jgi:hypothetical protein
MFDKTPNDLQSTLFEMERRSRERSQFDQVAAKQKMKIWMAQDARFKDFDPDRTIDELQKARGCGGKFDVEAPELKRGGVPRVSGVNGRTRWTSG